MADNYRYQSGRYGYQAGGYPTGRSPLVLDLANPVYAMTQQMIKRKEQEVAGNKSQIAGNVQAVLDAMSFEKVKGLGKQVQEKHLQRLDELDTKWVERLSEKDGMLSAKDLQELSFDKQSVEQDIANMKSDVEKIAQVSGWLAEDYAKNPDERSFDIEATALEMQKAREQIGQGINPFSMLVPRKITVDEAVENYFGKGLDTIADELSKNITSIKDGVITYKEGNRESLDALLERESANYTQDQRLGRYEQPQAKAGLKRALGRRVIDKVGFSQQGYRSGSGDEKYSGAAHMANVILEGLRRGDVDIVSQVRKSGTVKEIKLDDKENAYYITTNSGVTKKINRPSEEDNEEQIRAFKTAMTPYLPMSTKFLSSGFIGDIVADYTPYMNPDTKWQKAKDWRYDWLKESLEGTTQQKLTDLKELNAPFVERVDNVVSHLKDVLKEGATVQMDGHRNWPNTQWEDDKLWATKDKKSKYRIVISVDGKNYGFDLREKSENERLWKFVEKNSIYSEPAEEPKKDEQQPKLGQEPKAEQNELRTQLLKNANSYDELVQKFIERYELTEADAKEALKNDLNITAKDFD